jgi:uncharacterized iron-regulated protein
MLTRPYFALVLAFAALAALPAAGAARQNSVDTAYTAGEYRVYTGGGRPATLDDVIAAMARNQVVFIGESHDDPTGHMLEAELLKRAWTAYGDRASSAASRTIALSLEFFEHDVQPIVDEYLADLIAESAFRTDSRPWPRYTTDYRPLIEFSKEHGLAVIAANAPRRYVTRVSQHGRESLDSLSAFARANLPPLPYGQPSKEYRDQWIRTISEVMEQEGMKCGVPVEHAAAPAGSHGNMGNQLQSQALWDASMAWWISRYLESHAGALVLHMVGGFHVERGTGTPEHLQAYRPGTRALIVMLRPVDDIARFEPAPSGEWGDFVIQTDRTRTLEEIECRAYRAEHAGR